MINLFPDDEPLEDSNQPPPDEPPPGIEEMWEFEQEHHIEHWRLPEPIRSPQVQAAFELGYLGRRGLFAHRWYEPRLSKDWDRNFDWLDVSQDVCSRILGDIHSLSYPLDPDLLGGIEKALSPLYRDLVWLAYRTDQGNRRMQPLRGPVFPDEKSWDDLRELADRVLPVRSPLRPGAIAPAPAIMRPLRGFPSV